MVLVLYYRNIEDNAKNRECVFREINHKEPPASLNGGMRMFKLYYPNETNTGRQREFDYLKGIIMVLLYNLHFTRIQHYVRRSDINICKGLWLCVQPLSHMSGL